MAFDGSAIVELLDGAVSRGAVHGVAAVVVDRSGQQFHHAAGEAGERTLFRNASMTKAVATTAALQLVEQGRLSLESTVESILPEFGRLSVLDGFDGDKPRLRPPASKATVRQLMTHSAGLGYFFLNEKLLPIPCADRGAHAVVGLEAQPVGTDGQRSGYCVGVRRQHRLAWARGREAIGAKSMHKGQSGDSCKGARNLWYRCRDPNQDQHHHHRCKLEQRQPQGKFVANRH